MLSEQISHTGVLGVRSSCFGTALRQVFSLSLFSPFGTIWPCHSQEAAVPFHALAVQLEPECHRAPCTMQVSRWSPRDAPGMGSTDMAPLTGSRQTAWSSLPCAHREEQHWHGCSSPFPQRGAQVLPVFRHWDFLGDCSLSFLCPST